MKRNNSPIKKHKPRENSSKPNNRSSLMVSVRVRPLNDKEKKFSEQEIIEISDNKYLSVLDPLDQLKQTKLYTFANAFPKDTNQETVYDSSVKPLIPLILDGFNCTVFAYGPTGTGKTYTMLGDGNNPGVMARSLGDLFYFIEQSREKKDYKVKIVYVEIYNETIRDLLSTNDNLEMHEDTKKGIIIAGANELEIKSATEVFVSILKGNNKRTTESTVNNEESSRSHAILQIFIEANDKTKQEATLSKFLLVDLAGSERAHNSKSKGMRAIEGGNINKSLLALGNCINALVERNSKNIENSFIPWRTSKLTRILKV